MGHKHWGGGGPGKVDPVIAKMRRKAENERRQREQQARRREEAPREEAGGAPGKHFVNPYTFAPTPDRAGIPRGTYAGDYDPNEAKRGENALRLWEDRWSGTIGVTLTAETPLVLTRHLDEDESKKEHKTYDCLDTPPATGIKGMIRSAYETITNSRYGVLNEKQHGTWVGMRQTTNFALKLVPVIIEHAPGNGGDPKFVAKLLEGATPAGQQGARGPRGAPLPLHAAWIKRYDVATRTKDRNENAFGCKYPDGSLPRHKDPVIAELVPVVHDRKGFHFFGVAKIWHKTDARKNKDAPPPALDWNGNGGVVEGHVCVTGPTIKNKHDERVFFKTNGARSLPVDTEIKDRYEALIANYQEIHERDLAKRKTNRNEPSDYLGHEPGKTAFGPYVYDKGWNKLQHGDLLHALIEGGRITGLFPAMIPRDLHPKKVVECMHESLLPAKERADLSPAERLFGWVNPGGSGAWRGKVRVTGVAPMAHPDGGAAVERFEAPVPLAILGAPKTTQARFYLGDAQGRAPGDGLPKDRMRYDGQRRTRGRKLFWRPAGIARDEAYWRRPWEDRTGQSVAGHHQEYRQPGGASERTDQNRSINGWIRPGSTTTFQLRVENATAEEVGGLLALLHLAGNPRAEDACMRLGFGKPLGLGCVRVALDPARTNLRRNAEWKAIYAELKPLPAAAEPPVADLIQAHQKAMVTAYAVPAVDVAAADAMPPGALAAAWRGLPFVRAFLAAAVGPPGGAPVHYPRAQPERSDGRDVLPAYQWFVANDRVAQGRTPGRCLPDGAAEDPALPYQPVA